MQKCRHCLSQKCFYRNIVTCDLVAYGSLTHQCPSSAVPRRQPCHASVAPFGVVVNSTNVPHSQAGRHTEHAPKSKPVTGMLLRTRRGRRAFTVCHVTHQCPGPAVPRSRPCHVCAAPFGVVCCARSLYRLDEPPIVLESFQLNYMLRYSVYHDKQLLVV